MTSAISIGQNSGISQGPASCSVCLEVVKDVGDRSIAKLACGHHFHLDCIGSAFNAKGTMQCPNCRQIEDGLWLFPNGCRQLEDPLVSDILNEDEQGLHAGESDLFIPHDFMRFGHFHWCPYQTSIAQFSQSPGNTDHPRAAYADVVVNVIFNDHLDHGAGQVLSPPQEHWPQWAFAPSTATNSAGSFELGFLRANDGQRWTRSDVDNSQASGRSIHYGDNSVYHRPGNMATNTMGTHNTVPLALNHNLYSGGFLQMAPAFSRFNVFHSRRRRVPAETQPSNGLYVHYPPELPGPLSLGFVGISTVQDNATVVRRGAGQRDSTAFTQWRQEGWPSTFLQYPLEPEVRRWVLPPGPGLHGMHSVYGSDVSTQAGFRAPEAHFFNPFQGPLHAYLAPVIAEPQMINVESFHPQTSLNPLTR